MRMRRPTKFNPSASFHLEDRVVLSDLGLSGPAVVQVQTAAQTAGGDDFRIPADSMRESPLVARVQGQINQAFGNFAQEYRALRSAYFSTLLEPQADPSILPDPQTTLDNYRQGIRDQAARLGQDIQGVLDEVEGGAAVLDAYAAVRANQLAGELASVPGVGQGPFNPVEFATLGEQAINDANFAINQFVELYDSALYQTAAGIFSGNLRFFRGGPPASDGLPTLSPVVGQVQGEFNSAFAALADDFRQLRQGYYNDLASGDADFGAFQQVVAQRIEALRGQLFDAIEAPVGGSGSLQNFLTFQVQQFQQSFARLPAVGESGLTPDGFSAISEELIARSLNDAKAMVQLYDASLSTTALNFFAANPRVRALLGGAVRNLGAGQGVDVAAQVAGSAAGVGTARQLGGFDPGLGGVTGGFGGLGGIPTGLAGSFTDRLGLGADSFFNTTPTGFDTGLGFGGLGTFGGLNPGLGVGVGGTNSGLAGFNSGLGGFNSGLTGLGGNFSTGFGFGNAAFPGFGNAGLGFGNTVGFGTPTGGFGLGNGFGVVGGPGFGTGLGFGGFFF